MTGKDDVSRMVKIAMATCGRVDVLVDNAGIPMPKRFEECTAAGFREIVSADGPGYLFCMWEVLPVMNKQGGGCAINASSKSATTPSELTPFYCFAKAGMDHFTRCLNNEYVEFGIRLNPFSLWSTLSEMTRVAPRFHRLAEGVPMKRYVTADETAGAAVFLAAKDVS